MMNDSKKGFRRQKSSQAYMEQHCGMMENGLHYSWWFDEEVKAVKLVCD